MTLRRRLALVAAAAVAVAIVLASGIVYVVVRGELRGTVDDDLQQAGHTADIARIPLASGGLRMFVSGAGAGAGPEARVRRLLAPRDALGLQTTYLALVDDSGARVLPRDEADAGGDGAPDEPQLPVTAATRAVAAGTHGPFFADARVDDTAVRVYTMPLRGLPGFAIQVARPLTEVDRTLDRLALVLALVSAAGIALAAGLGLVVARTALRPVRQLTSAVEHVGETGDLSRRIDLGPSAGGRGGRTGENEGDEIARLARSFNAMLGALEASVGRQRQLVADASHELRTPLTSVRTNIEVLALPAGLPEEERSRLLADVVEQLDELGALVGDLVELAREEESAVAVEDVRIDLLVEEAVTRARRRPGAPVFATELEPSIVRGVPARLDRAIANLLDNAAKWSPIGAEVTVTLRGGELAVRDRGPGIAAADLPHVFERFYRAPAARGMPGSGLGLAIVRQVAELHGGTATAHAAPDGGALLRLALPAEVMPTRSAARDMSLPEPLAPAANDGRAAGGDTSMPAG
ncbi:MAG TPA: HAMP domain-containing sensor histidine kinase [Conexibacter sp.]|jgi:two-component system sensor histidine kinase MprB